MRVLDNEFGVQILEQSFALLPSTYQDLLDRSIGQTITFTTINPLTQHSESRQGILINPETADGSMLVDVDGRVEKFMDARVSFNNTPSHIMPFPSLHAVFESGQETPAIVEMSYITPGVGWSMNYTAEVNESDDTVDFLGLATIQNQTLIDFHQAEMMLVATLSPKKVDLSEEADHKPNDTVDGGKNGKTKTDKLEKSPQKNPHGQKESHSQEFKTRDLRGNSYAIMKLVDLAPKQTKNIVCLVATNETMFF